MAAALGRVGHILMQRGRSSIPEDFGHKPRAVAIKDDKAETLLLQLLRHAPQGHGGGHLQKRACLGVNGRTQKVVGRGVVDVEMDGVIFACAQFQQQRLAELQFLDGRRGLQRLLAQFRDGAQRDGGHGLANGACCRCIRGSNRRRLRQQNGGEQKAQDGGRDQRADDSQAPHAGQCSATAIALEALCASACH